MKEGDGGTKQDRGRETGDGRRNTDDGTRNTKPDPQFAIPKSQFLIPNSHFAISCPFCSSRQVELFSMFGSQLLTSEYYCRDCRTVFESVKR